MKKLIAAALSLILGTLGYTVVDKTIEDRVGNLEAQVSIQQSIIDDMNVEAAGLRLASDMPVGTKMLCIPSEPTVYTLENGTEVQIDSFTNTVVEHRELGKLGAVGDAEQYAQSLFEIEIKGKTDPSYAGKYMTFCFVINTDPVAVSYYDHYYISDLINPDGTFCVKQKPKGFVQEFVCEIREIEIKDKPGNPHMPTVDDTKATNKKDDETTKKETTTEKKTYSGAEIVKICTDAINKAKNESPGYTKKKYQKLEGDRSAVPAFYNVLFGVFEEDSAKTYKPGQADITSFGVDGWVATKVSDPESIKMEVKNGKYIINYTFGNETNPADLNSKYGRSMDIMTPKEVKDTSLGIISDITMQYYDGFLTAEVDIETGRLTYMKMGAHVDAEVNTSMPNNAFTVKDIVSTATYTDFIW